MERSGRPISNASAAILRRRAPPAPSSPSLCCWRPDGQQTPRLFSLGGRALALGNQASCNLPIQLLPPRLIELHCVIEA